MKKVDFYSELKNQFQTCNLPEEKVNVNWKTVKVLDMDLRNIARTKSKGNRILVLIGKDKKTKKTVVLKQELCGYNSAPQVVIREALNKLTTFGYKIQEAKTMLRFYIDLHNPDGFLIPSENI